MLERNRWLVCGLGLLAGGLSGYHNSSYGGNSAGQPDYTLLSSIIETHYDGINDDLLTAGLGKTGLAADTR